MGKADLPKEFLERLHAITAKRARAVIDHIVEHGHVTTEELARKYGYGHPPRGARDVREQGIPLETFFLKDSKGRRMAAYRFADPREVRRGMLGGRKVSSKEFKEALAEANGSKCHICLQPYEDRYLQVDHRVPYEVAGEVSVDERQAQDYMLVCGSCNRAKSWSCEHCTNWIETKETAVCESCYWARPESYTHVATEDVRRLDLVGAGNDVADYDRLKAQAAQAKSLLPDFVREILKGIRLVKR
ncbi:MAG: HNH endonuclease [Acidobacteria bacterium]|nr:HNH endonuclease [Acidobacteriota bacterium]